MQPELDITGAECGITKKNPRGCKNIYIFLNKLSNKKHHICSLNIILGRMDTKVVI